jgi:putative transcriptional regulator
MTVTRMTLKEAARRGRVNPERVDATTEDDIARQIDADDAAARADAAAYARRVRRRLGLDRGEFARRIGVSVEMVTDWEQGGRPPEGAARTLLRVLDRAPEAALAALE